VRIKKPSVSFANETESVLSGTNVSLAVLFMRPQADLKSALFLLCCLHPLMSIFYAASVANDDGEMSTHFYWNSVDTLYG